MLPTEIPYDALFDEYLRVCNAALLAHKDCFPYDRILHQIEFLLTCHPVQVALYDEDEKRPKAFYEIAFQDGKLIAQEPHKPYAKRPWQLGKYFLEQVSQHPDAYIQNPAQLNWAWLTDHGIGV